RSSVVVVDLIALAQQHAGVTAAVAVNAPFEAVVDPLAVVDLIEAGEPVRIEQIRLVELEVQAVFIGDETGVAAVGRGVEGEDRFENLADAAGSAHERIAPLEGKLGE